MVLRHGRTRRQGRDRHRNQPRRRRRHRARTIACRRHRHRLLARRRSTRYPASKPNPAGPTSAQMVCDQGDYRAIDAFVSEVADTYGRIDILVNNAGGTVPTPHVEDVPELVQQIQGAPRSDDDFERTVLFHAFADPDEPDQPAVVRHPGVPADAATRTAPAASSTSPAAPATPPVRRRWCPTARPSPASTT